MEISIKLILFLLVLSHCAAGPCRNQNDEVASKPMNEKRKQAAQDIVTPEHLRIYVYKFDGTLQCEDSSQAPSPESMKNQLIQKGIEIFEVVRQHSGFFMPQACGQPKGMIYRFEIAKHHLEAAQSLGFKQWVDPNK